MTPAPARRFIQHIGAMSSNRVILSELLSSRAHFRFPGLTQAQPSTPVRQQNPSERHTGTSHSVSPKGVTPFVSSPQFSVKLANPFIPQPKITQNSWPNSLGQTRTIKEVRNSKAQRYAGPFVCPKGG